MQFYSFPYTLITLRLNFYFLTVVTGIKFILRILQETSLH